MAREAYDKLNGRHVINYYRNKLTSSWETYHNLMSKWETYDNFKIDEYHNKLNSKGRHMINHYQINQYQHDHKH